MDAPERAVYTEADGLEAAGAWTPVDGAAEYIRADLAPDAALVAELVEALRQCDEIFTRFEINHVNGDEIADAARDGIRAVLAKLEGKANG